MVDFFLSTSIGLLVTRTALIEGGEALVNIMRGFPFMKFINMFLEITGCLSHRHHLSFKSSLSPVTRRWMRYPSSVNQSQL